MKTYWKAIILCAALGVVSGCGETGDAGGSENGTETNSGSQQQAAPTIQAPQMNADSAYAYTAKQCEFGPRVPGTPAHQQCGDWLVAQLRRFGAAVTEQTAVTSDNKGGKVPVRNIIASYNPQAKKRIMLSAHWDTRPVADEDTVKKNEPIMGANDGASGVAVLLELARVFSENPPPVGVDIFLWDAEDGGKTSEMESWCIGSQYWSNNMHAQGYRAAYGVNLDMVGAENAVFMKEQRSVQTAGNIVNRIWNTAHQLGYGQYFSMENGGSITDDHYFVNKITGIPYVNIIHIDPERRRQYLGSFFEHWHTHGDNMSVIRREPLKAVGQTLLQVLFNEQPAI